MWLTDKDAEKDFEKHIIKSIKTSNKKFFKYIRSRKPARVAVGPLDDNGIKAILMDNKAIADKLN